MNCKWVRILSFVNYKLNISAAWLLQIICSFLGKSETYGRVRQEAGTELLSCSWDLPQEEGQNWKKLWVSEKLLQKVEQVSIHISLLTEGLEA